MATREVFFIREVSGESLFPKDYEVSQVFTREVMRLLNFYPISYEASHSNLKPQLGRGAEGDQRLEAQIPVEKSHNLPGKILIVKVEEDKMYIACKKGNTYQWDRKEEACTEF